ncbi:MAG: PRC-barrel domain containing protein [Acidimicrobiales bacterium]
MAHIEDLGQWKGEAVVDPGGERMGKLAEIYYDSESDEPVFFGVKMGMMGHSLAFVPSANAAIGKDRIVVGYARSVVKNAPTIEAGAELPADEEAKIFDYYQVPYEAGSTPSGKRLVRK